MALRHYLRNRFEHDFDVIEFTGFQWRGIFAAVTMSQVQESKGNQRLSAVGTDIVQAKGNQCLRLVGGDPQSHAGLADNIERSC